MTRYIVRRPFDYLNRRQVVGREWVPRGHWKDEWLIARGFVVAIEPEPTPEPTESAPEPKPEPVELKQAPERKRRRRGRPRKRGK